MLFVSPMCLISFLFACFRFFILEFYFVVVFCVVVVLCELFSFSSDYSIFSMYIDFFFSNYFPLFQLSQIVKLKTKIKPFCFRARKILSFVEMLVVWACVFLFVCMLVWEIWFFCFSWWTAKLLFWNRHFSAFFHFKLQQTKTENRTMKRKQKFSFSIVCTFWNRLNCVTEDNKWNRSWIWETNEKNVKKMSRFY